MPARLRAHALIAIGGSKFDADALAAFTAIEATGASLTGAQKAAANTLIVGMKANSIWTTTDCLYLLLGGTSAAHAVNWRTPGTFNMTWTNSPTHSANGVQFGGTSHGRTGYNPSTQSMDASKCGLFGYINSVGSGNRPMLAAQNNPAPSEFLLIHNVANELIAQIGDVTARAATHPTTTSNGLYVGQRNSTTEIRRWINGTKTTATTPATSTASVSLQMYAGCYNFGGIPALYSNARVALLGLYRNAWSDAAQTAFNTLVAAYQTALSRA